MSISSMSRITERSESVASGKFVYDDDDEECPDYDAVVSRSHTLYARGVFHEPQSPNVTPALNTPRRPRPLPRHERYVYTYRMVANGAPLQYLISVEPESGKPIPGKCTFRLSLKVNGVERAIGEPATKTLKMDPRQLEFIVFMFPGKQGLPTGCMWSLRVWLRVTGIDHRIFGEDELWIGKDPDFNAIGDASFARLKSSEPAGEHIYQAYVGRALVTFSLKWKNVSNKLYTYTLEYEAGGAGDVLFDDIKLKIDGDPRNLSFLIFSVPSNSIPAGASHKLRLWLRTLIPLAAADPAYVHPFNDSYIYQRIWKNDSFKIGARLDFDSLGSKMVMAFPYGHAETIVMPGPQPAAADLNSPRSMFKEKRKGYDF